MPSAADIGAATAEEVIRLKDDKLDKTGTAADSSKLGGKTIAEIMLALYPVGAVYISENSTSPASLFGGTWEQIEDRFLLAAGSTYAAGSAGGEATHTLTVVELPKHSHDAIMVNGDINYKILYGKNGDIETRAGSISYEPGSGVFELETAQSGSGAAHNNMPPYLAVYMWKRVN